MGLPWFYYPTPTGIVLAHPRDHLSTPAVHHRHLPRAFNYIFSHWCCTIYHAQESSLWCRRQSRQYHLRGPCSGGEGDTRAGTTGFSDRPGVRALVKIYMEPVYSGESWTIDIESLHACLPILPSYAKANHFSLSDDFRPVSPSFGCGDCFKNRIVTCQFFNS